MPDIFIEAQRRRKRRTKFWREHIVLAYAVVFGAAIVFYLFIFAVNQVPAWLGRLGVGPRGVALVSGTISCGFGFVGLREPRSTTSVIGGVLCLMIGAAALGRAFGLY